MYGMKDHARVSYDRGFAAIGVVSPKCDYNIGGLMRAAACYGAGLIVLSGSRYKRQSADTAKAYKHIPTIHNVSDPFDAAPFDAVPVAVDLVEGAEMLPDFIHPERAFYIFGPEDGTLGGDILKRCKHRVAVPTHICMNLAATVNVVLYDRLVKRAALPRREAA